MTLPRIKVCGITSIADAVAVTASGVNVLGLVFYSKSRRCVSIEQAIDIARSVPPFTCIVGLFVDATDMEVQAVLQQVPLSVLQFHGNESEAECNRWNIPYIKALRVRPEIPIINQVAPYTSASGYLLDSYRPGLPGGTGETFDWGLIPVNLGKPIILAGGLNSGNVRKAIIDVQPYAVDVSSGVELAPGIKDIEAVKAFVKAAGK